LPSDHGWRRWHVVDGRRCWYVEGERHAPHRFAAAASLDKGEPAFVPRTPSAPQAEPEPPSPTIYDPPQRHEPQPAAPIRVVLADPYRLADARPGKGDRLAAPRPEAQPIEVPTGDHQIAGLAVAIAALIALAIGLHLNQPRPLRGNHWS
jgi:hypothetical protein